MLREKVYQMFITGTGKNLDYFLRNGLGGVIFFTRDIDSKGQFSDLVKGIKSKYTKILPFLSIDQEGGRVERTENIHPRYKSAKEAYNLGEEFLKKQTETIAKELSEYGLNMNFAPCIDVNSNPNNPIIADRAFSDNPSDVCKGYDIVSGIYSDNGIIPVVKHFPGHGDADKDSHKELPVINLSFAQMEQTHIYPFRHAVDNGADVVMVAHLHCPCFDSEVIPTSLSKNCIGYLRNKLGFNGLVMSDDMFMKGVAEYGMVQACVMGIEAGINMFIYRDASDETLDVIENIVKLAGNNSELRELIDNSYDKILRLKQKYQLIMS